MLSRLNTFIACRKLSKLGGGIGGEPIPLPKKKVGGGGGGGNAEYQ